MVPLHFRGYLFFTAFPWADYNSMKTAFKLHVGLDDDALILAFVSLTDGKAGEMNKADQWNFPLPNDFVSPVSILTPMYLSPPTLLATSVITKKRPILRVEATPLASTIDSVVPQASYDIKMFARFGERYLGNEIKLNTAFLSHEFLDFDFDLMQRLLSIRWSHALLQDNIDLKLIVIFLYDLESVNKAAIEIDAEKHYKENSINRFPFTVYQSLHDTP